MVLRGKFYYAKSFLLFSKPRTSDRSARPGPRVSADPARAAPAGQLHRAWNRLCSQGRTPRSSLTRSWVWVGFGFLLIKLQPHD